MDESGSDSGDDHLDETEPQIKAPKGWGSNERGPPEIDPTEIVYGPEDFLGEGAFGKVYRGVCRGQRVAIKIPSNQNLSDAERREFQREVSTMSQIFNPNVVLFMGAATKGKIMIVTELMKGSLEKFLRTEGKKTPLVTRIKMAKDAALGLNWLHGINKMIHRDLKPENLLVDENGRVKVTDFGFTEYKPPGTGSLREGRARGSPLWMAPEVMKLQDFDGSVDVYAFGIVLWEIVTCVAPFSHHNNYDKFVKAVADNGERPPVKQCLDMGCPQSVVDLMQKCWVHNRADRPTFSQVIEALDHIIVDLTIEDEKARAFWKKYFLVQKKQLLDKVPWIEFRRCLRKRTKLKDEEFLLIKEIILHEVNDSKVSIERFNQVSVWAGHFFVRGEAEQALLDLKALTNAEWYHGLIDAQTAELRLLTLKNAVPGTYLVRLSTKFADYPFTISILSAAKNKVEHRRVKRTRAPNGGSSYSVNTETGKELVQYPTIAELIEGVSKDLKLKDPCPIPESKQVDYGGNYH